MRITIFEVCFPRRNLKVVLFMFQMRMSRMVQQTFVEWKLPLSCNVDTVSPNSLITRPLWHTFPLLGITISLQSAPSATRASSLVRVIVTTAKCSTRMPQTARHVIFVAGGFRHLVTLWLTVRLIRPSGPSNATSVIKASKISTTCGGT